MGATPLSIIALSIMTLSIMTFSIMTFSIMTFSIKGIHLKRFTHDTQHKQLSALMMFTITTLYHHHKILINDNQYTDA